MLKKASRSWSRDFAVFLLQAHRDHVMYTTFDISEVLEHWLHCGPFMYLSFAICFIYIERVFRLIQQSSKNCKMATALAKPCLTADCEIR